MSVFSILGGIAHAHLGRTHRMHLDEAAGQQHYRPDWESRVRALEQFIAPHFATESRTGILGSTNIRAPNWRDLCGFVGYLGL